MVKYTSESQQPEIKTTEDLHTAVSKAATAEDRKHIHKRATYLGLLQHVPKHWNADGTLKAQQ